METKKGNIMKSGVYFVHYDDIDAFLAEAKKAGRTLLSTGSYEKIKDEEYKGLYRVFSVDNGQQSEPNRIGYWDAMTLDAMEYWSDWSFTDNYIEHWRPKKIIL